MQEIATALGIIMLISACVYAVSELVSNFGCVQCGRSVFPNKNGLAMQCGPVCNKCLYKFVHRTKELEPCVKI